MSRCVMIGLAMILGLAQHVPAEKPKPLGRGQQWVRSHPFTLAAYLEFPVNMEQYKAMGFTSTIATVDASQAKNTDLIFGQSDKLGLGWHWFCRWSPGKDQQTQTRRILEGVRQLRSRYGGNLGFSIGDENSPEDLYELGKLLDEARRTAPDALVYGAMRGMDFIPDYTYKPEQYLHYVDRVITDLRPDVLMYDQYPFYRGETAQTFYQNLAVVREKALAAGVPYWNWLQGFAWTDGPFHDASESELRLQAFASLTYGYSGLMYWTYASCYPPYSHSLLDGNGRQTALCRSVAVMLPELRILGNAIKNLTSTGVYYCSSKMFQNGQWLYPLPPGTVRWMPQVDPRLMDIQVSDGPQGFLVGLFCGDDGRQYLMLTNTNHGKDRSARETLGVVTVRFDTSIDTLERLDRATGSWIRIHLGHHILLHHVLPGGTGDLFRFATK